MSFNWNYVLFTVHHQSEERGASDECLDDSSIDLRVERLRVHLLPGQKQAILSNPIMNEA